jgi:hypothetical protein
MESTAAESRDRLIVQAKRKALIDDVRRARRSLPSGIVLVAVGAGITAAGLILPLGPFPMMAVSLFGLAVVPFGVAILGRAAYTITSAPRKIRELDTLALAPARVVSRD